MAEMTSYIGIDPRTVTATAVALARGVRVIRNSSGFVAVADNTVRGDYVTLEDIEADGNGAAASASDGGKVPALASEASAAGDLAYAAADGKFSVTSTDSALMGRWTVAASGDDVLGEVELFPVE